MNLTDTERARLADLACVMIPGDDCAPGAPDLGLHIEPVDNVLQIDGTRVEPLRRFLSLAGATETLADIEASAQMDPDGFQALSVVLANAYFMHPKTRAAIGYPGQEARDSSAGLTDEDMRLVDVVRSRGAIYRSV